MTSDPCFIHLERVRETVGRAITRDYMEIFGVRITPPYLEFKGAFGGETYKQKMSIQNISRKQVVLKIATPTSFAYQVKSVRNYSLSPGLCLVREVTYTYTHETSFSCILPLYIDGNRYDYKLFAISPSSKIEVTPLLINFGLLDAGCSSPTRDIVLRNVGDKPTRFYIDNASTNEYTIIVDPVKGMLQPKQSVTAGVRLIPSKEGELFINLWVKADEHSMLQITADVIVAKLEPISDCLAKTFTLIDFPETYVGLTVSRTIYVRNYSSSAAMFNIDGEINNVVMRLEDCREQEIDYRYCTVYPNSGMFQSREVKAIHFKFHPTKLPRGQKLKPFYFCVFRMCRIKSRYLTVEDSYELKQSESSPTIHTKSSCGSWTISDQQETDSFLTNSYFVRPPESLKPVDDIHYIKFLVHGLVEEPSVAVTPDEIVLHDLLVGQKETRVFQLKNNSLKLPIIFVYKKVAYIDLDQPRIFVKPSSSVEITVNVLPHNIGTFKTQVQFDLAFYDHPKTHDNCKVIGKIALPVEFNTRSVKKTPQAELSTGITPTYIRETGKFCDDVKFSTPVRRPKAAVVAHHLVSKTSSALMALPNDRPRSTRPWRSDAKCKTLFTKTPRYVPPLDTEYELTVFDRKVKMTTESYYTNYTRRMASKLRPALPPPAEPIGDSISPGLKLICKGLKLVAPSSIHVCNHDDSCTPLHLSPEAIANIVVTPLNARIGPMAAHNSCEFNINIKNKNPNVVSIKVVSDKPNVVFPNGNRQIIKGNDEIDLTGIYISHGMGYYTAELKLIMNECAFITTQIFANVCPITLNLQTDSMMFSEEVTNHYLEISNSLSSDVFFRWDLQCKNFRIEPAEAVVKRNDSLMCYVQYLPSQPGPLVADAVLITSDKNTQHLRLGVRTASKMLFFVKNKLVFRDIPLNIPVIEKVLLKNNSGVSQIYSLVSDHFKDYVKVFPSHGTVYPNSYAVIIITLRLSACVTFNTRLRFQIGKFGFIELGLIGNVVYPEIETCPTMIHFKKIPCSTVDMIKFTISNRSNALASVRFDMSMYPEFHITQTDRNCDTEKVDWVQLEKHTSIQLYVRFTPVGLCNDQFYLPMIINDILGPVVNQAAAKRVAYFLTDVVPDSKPITFPKALFLTLVLCQATEGKITLSKTTIFLSYVPPPNICKPEYDLKIVNEQHESEEFCIRLDDLAHPFYVTYLRGRQPLLGKKAIVCKLEPKEVVIFNISFRPERVGHYRVLLPLYIRSDNSDTPHNYVRIKGDFPPPIITSENPVIFFKALPLKIAVQGTRKFTLENHFENCTVQSRSSLAELVVEVQKRFPTGKNTQELWVLCQCRPLRVINEQLTISVSCSCGTVCEVIAYVVAENDFFTNYALVYNCILSQEGDLGPTGRILTPTSRQRSHASEASMVDVNKKHDLTSFFPSYPFYPLEDDELYEFMEDCVAAMESWIYMQGFNGKCFYKLPDSISHIPCGKNCKSEKSNKKICVPPFIQLLINLLGEGVLKYFELGNFSEREDEQANYIYTLYKAALTMLKELGACLICNFPEYLMPFNMYTYYTKNRLESCYETETMDVTELPMFYRLSKQCWLDLMLQTYKVLTFSRLLCSLNNGLSTVPSVITPHSKYHHAIENVDTNNHVFSSAELLVLYWLEFHYNEVREMYWAHNKYLKERYLSHFCEDMVDGFVYAAVTLAYCPYLQNHFKKLCQNPTCYEEYLHNNIRVVQSWEILNFSLGITVTDLMNLHQLRSLMVALSKKETKSLTIKNSNHFPVAYKAIIYGDEDRCFKVNDAVQVVEARKEVEIDVEYWAKFAKRSQCTLILSGECKGHRYAKSKVITLIAESDVSFALMEFEFPIEMYKVTRIKFKITSPYTKRATYDLIYSCSEFKSVEDLQMAMSNANRQPFDLARCYPLESRIEFNDQGKADVAFVAFAVTDRVIPSWVVFRNQTLGDFTVYIPTIPSMTTNQEVIHVEVPPNYNELVRRGKIGCELFLEIPCRNRLLWKGLIDMMFLLNSDDLEFWQEHVATSTGMNILQKLIRFTSQSESLVPPRICAGGMFTVTKLTRSKINLPSTIVVENECLAGSIRVPMEVTDIRDLKPFTIKLKSASMRIRQYTVVFVFSSDENEELMNEDDS
ncbi:hypothetical protein Trydic_g7808 [Trypoxylus dichotomus]